jgi:nitrite reductase/ring-hydroxylating ferredoxin subunit
VKKEAIQSEIERESGSSRREFFAGATLGAAGIVPMCCGTPDAAAGSWSIVDGVVRIDLAREPALKKTGEPRAVVEMARKLNIIVVQHEKGRWAAIDRTCTHGAGMCAYEKRRRTIRCTSLNHAEYTLDGTLLHGRTHGNLRAYPAVERAGWLEIQLESRA